MNTAEYGIIGLFVLSVAVERLTKKSKKRSKQKRQTRASRDASSARITSNSRRTDDVILSTPLNKLSWAEGERLLALYFRDHGYEVEETGVGGNDGGVDLVLIDRKTNERTAVQIKWRSKSSIGPDVVRELHSARWNTTPRCLYGMLITNSEITQQARHEAQERGIDFWHGGMLSHKLSQWEKWAGNPKKSPRRSKTLAREETSAGSAKVKCVCGADMVKRKNKQGQPFWGCSTFPKCRHTQDIR